MSALFGESPPASPQVGRSRSTLFAEDDFAAGASNSLFADDGGTASPWANSPARRQRTDISTLLTHDNAKIPDEYREIWAKLIDEFGDGAETVGEPAAVKVFDEANVRDDGRNRILGSLELRQKGKIGREEGYVLLAMVGLCQEGDEDVTIDTVHERRDNLPLPTLKSLAPEPKALESPTEERPAIVKREHTSPVSTSPVRTRNASAIFDHQDDDGQPWAADAQKTSETEQIVETPGSINSPSSLQPPGDVLDDEEEDEPDDIHAALRNSGGASKASGTNSWGYYGVENQPETGFGGESYNAGFDFNNNSPRPDMSGRVGSFGGLGGNLLNGNSGGRSSQPTTSNLERIRDHMMAKQEEVIVTVLPEKEGVFMFQHRNYTVASTRGSRVVRRYSDFVWLLDCLHKRYPFRQLPQLPPKRLAVNGHYLSADASFIERRRRGLSRFVNCLVRHPVLVNEQLVIMFLTVPTELSVWRKQANLSVVEEFHNKPLDPGLEASLPADLNETFDTVRSGLRKSAELYIQICTLVERLEKRHEGIAADYLRFSVALRSLTDVSEATYAVDTSDVPQMNRGLNAVANHLSQSQTFLEDESKAWDSGALEDLKRQRDCLVSMKELFERMDRYAGDNIPQLKRRIETSEKKLLAHRQKPLELQRPQDAERLTDSIKKDEEDIERQKIRGILIKECVRDELVYFQGSQYHVGKLHQDWSQERVKYAELHADNWRQLSQDVECMPLRPFDG